MSGKTSSEIAIELAKRLKTLRLLRAWTREELAERSGVNIYSLKRFERTGQISLDRLLAIAQTLDVVQECERLFKPRQRINIDNWQFESQIIRQRGRKTTV